MHDFMMSMLYMHKLWFRYHEIALEYAVLRLSILTLYIKCMNKINSASDYMFSNYKTEQFV